jgi:hypothetical protein
LTTHCGILTEESAEKTIKNDSPVFSESLKKPEFNTKKDDHDLDFEKELAKEMANVEKFV